MINPRPRNFGDQIAVSVQQTARGAAQGAGTAVELARLAQSGRGTGAPKVGVPAVPDEVLLSDTVTSEEGSGSFEVVLPDGHLWAVDVLLTFDAEVPDPAGTGYTAVTSSLNVGNTTCGLADGRDWAIFENTSTSVFGVQGAHGLHTVVDATFTVSYSSGTDGTCSTYWAARWLRPLQPGERVL